MFPLLAFGFLQFIWRPGARPTSLSPRLVLADGDTTSRTWTPEDRRLNEALKIARSSSDNVISSLDAAVADFSHEAWRVAANLNLLLQTFFDTDNPSRAFEFLNYLSKVQPTVCIPGRSLTYALREFLKVGQTDRAEYVFRLALDSGQLSGGIVATYSVALTRRGDLSRSREVLEAVGAMANDGEGILGADLLLLSRLGDWDGCRRRWVDSRQTVLVQDKLEGVAVVIEALVVAGMLREALSLAPKFIRPDLVFLAAGRGETPPAVALKYLIDSNATSQSALMEVLLKGYWSAGRVDYILRTHDLAAGLCSSKTSFNLFLAAAKTSMEAGTEGAQHQILKARELLLSRIVISPTDLDEVSICTGIDLAAAAGDYEWGSRLYRAGFTEGPRSTHCFLRCFRDSSQLARLVAFTEDEILPRRRLDARTVDELVNAYLRVGGLPSVVQMLCPSLQARQDRRMLRLGALRNILIAFERHHRDWASVGGADTEAEGGLAPSRSLIEESAAVVKILVSNVEGHPEELVLWGALIAVLLSRGEYTAAVTSLHAMEAAGPRSRVYVAMDVSRALELGVYSALEGALPLLTTAAPALLQTLRRGGSLSSILGAFNRDQGLAAADKRIVCSMDNIVAFLGQLGALRVPVGVHLLQVIFEDALGQRQRGAAAAVIRLLERGRLVIDLRASELHRVLAVDQELDVQSVEAVRQTLASKWSAQVVGASLNRLQTNVAGSLRRLMLSQRKLEEGGKDDENLNMM